jgi:hypothetical protein
MAGLQQINTALDLVPNATTYFRTSGEKTTFVNLAQDDYFKELAGEPTFMGRGGPVSTINFQQTSLLNTKLTRFYKQYLMQETGLTELNEQIWSIDVEDRVIYDVKLLLTKATGQTNGVPVKVLPDNQVYGRVNSETVPPTIQVPIGKYYSDNQYIFWPTPENAPIAYCLVLPTPCLIVLNEDLTYNEVDSIDLEWDESAVTAIFTRALKYAGVNISNQMVEQIAQNLTRVNV